MSEATIVIVEEDVKEPEAMSAHELLVELVTSARELRTAIDSVGPALASHPMLKMFGGSLGSLLGGK